LIASQINGFADHGTQQFGSQPQSHGFGGVNAGQMREVASHPANAVSQAEMKKQAIKAEAEARKKMESSMIGA